MENLKNGEVIMKKVIDIEYMSGKIRVQRTKFKKRDYIDIRKFYQNQETMEWKPTRKGISFDPDFKDKIIEALKKI